jgi:hypothetical protein
MDPVTEKALIWLQNIKYIITTLQQLINLKIETHILSPFGMVSFINIL